MATKSLARTAIEGGRRTWNKWERRYSHKEERAEERAALAKVKDAEDWDEVAPRIKRKVVRPQFSDKLNPMYRFLDANVGRKWSKVYAEVKQKFDHRTTAGRHITYDHLLREVSGSGTAESASRWSWSRYYVDASGVLKKTPAKHRYSKVRGKQISNAPKPKVEKLHVDMTALAGWLVSRRVAVRRGKLVWAFSPRPCRPVVSNAWVNTKRQWSLTWWLISPLSGEYLVQQDILGREHKIPATTHGWRLGRRLSPDAVRYWNMLPAALQDVILGEDKSS